ncbi:MAG TPA: PAS domain-containing protein [Trebonia sp.]|jgi:PAS domain S-box-containing protein|nr:PAS domain-containing protein [Trebonia sp.]
MPIDGDAEIRALRTVLRDLVALSAIPVAWIGREPAAVAAGLADVLTGLLRLDFVFVRLCVPGVDGAVDATRGNAWTTFPEWLENRLAEGGRLSGMDVIPDVGGVEPCSGVVIPVGVDAEGMVAAACDRVGFPTETDQLLLRLAANHAATAFQSAALVHERMRAEEELRQARDELEMKVAERTAELRTSEAYLSEAQRLTHTGTAALDGVTGVVTHSSDEHSRLYGFDPEQGVPSFEAFRRRVHPEDRAAWTESLKRGMRKAAAVEGEFRVVPPGGPLRHLRAIVHPVFTVGGELAEFVGTVVDVTERRRAEEEHRAQLWFLESLDAFDRAIRGTSDLEQMMGDVLDVVLATFRCDRAWLVYPCDPAVDSPQVRMERTRPEYVDASGAGAGVPEQVARLSQVVLGSSSPVRFDPESERPLPPQLAECFAIQSMMAMAVYPKVDKPYIFGLQQCSCPRVWTSHEERLFHEIGRRLADALNTLLMFRDLRESQRKLERSRAELTVSRARIVTAADQTRRRIERDLHDGVQQRLVSLALGQRQALAMVPPELPELQAQLSRVVDGVAGALKELQEISRGIHPAILAQGGLAAALKVVARRSAVPVELEVRAETRLPEPVEVAAYYIVSEALTNTAKHAHASAVHVAIEARDGVLGLSIRDDGCGGADPARGSGLIGLTDRVDALGGTIEVASPVGAGTTLLIRLPVEGG